MRKVLKWFGILVGVLLILIIAAAVILYVVSNNKVNKDFDVQVEALTLPTDAAALERGQHLVEAVSACTSCHGDNLGGDEMLDSFMMGTAYGANLTTGAGGLGADYSTEDWVRTIRHGVKPDGKSVVIMPSQYYYTLSDEDLAAMIAYLQSVPPVDNDTPETALGPFGTIMVGLMVGVPADEVDHDAPRPAAPETGVTAEYGEYLATIAACKECHGDDLSGGPAMAPVSAPDLTQSGSLGDWTEADFVKAIRTGLTPENEVIDSEEMPWDHYTLMTDDELSALWAYLQTLD